MARASLVAGLFAGAALLTVPAMAAADPAAAGSIGDAVENAFGRVVVISGEYAFVGEPGQGPAAAGKVWIYRRSGGSWQQVSILRPAEGTPAAGFGSALAADGNTLLIGQTVAAMGGFGGRGGGGGGQGAAAAAPAPQPSGTVHVYTRNAAGNWAPAGVLPGSHPAGARFGASLILAGDQALVGAPGDAGGAVHVFRRGANGGWSAAGRIAPASAAATDAFGAALSLDGNRLAVGATGEGGKGAVHIFERGTTGNWLAAGAPVVSRRSPDAAQFGGSLLLRGDRLLVGAPMARFVGFTAEQPAAQQGGQGQGQGAARRMMGGGGVGFVAAFERNRNGVWAEQAFLTPFDFPASAGFGTAIGMVGDELWIGAPTADGSGRIYQVALNAAGLPEGMRKLAVESVDGRGAQFGASFAVSGNSAVVGMPGDEGFGTIAFLERSATGSWATRGTVFPPKQERHAALTGKEVECGSGGRAGEFQCSNTSLLSFLPISAIGGGRSTGLSGNWGWTDEQTGADIAIIGRTDGTAFVDVTDPVNPRYLGQILVTPGANPSNWTEIKTYKHYALITKDGSGPHGVQIFDLHRLRDVKEPQTFEPDAIYREVANVHDILANSETGYAYAVGSNGGGEGCGGAYHIMDMKDPLNPKFAGCFADTETGRAKTGYSHDALCIVYRGPHAKYQGREICVGSNETAISITDLTDKNDMKILSRLSYPNVAYTHQGWWTEDHRYFYVNDELDETGGQGLAAQATRTLIFDLADLEDPVLVKEWLGTTKASDHNLYVRGNRMYQANYKAGLRIIDVSDPVNPREVGFFDVTPDDDNSPGFSGSWNNYPFFKSGAIMVNSMADGIFMVRDRTQAVP